MRLSPKVTLLCYDPRQPLSSLEVRGIVVEMTEAGALEHLNSLCELYTGKSPYFGTCVPAAFQEKERPVLGVSISNPAFCTLRMMWVFQLFGEADVIC